MHVDIAQVRGGVKRLRCYRNNALRQYQTCDVRAIERFLLNSCHRERLTGMVDGLGNGHLACQGGGADKVVAALLAYRYCLTVIGVAVADAALLEELLHDGERHRLRAAVGTGAGNGYRGRIA